MIVSVVVLNWNRKQDTEECVASLIKSEIDGFVFEIIVVDNGSSDDSEESLKKLDTKGISYEVIPTGKNLGFAAGNNVGIRHAINHGADFILILNNDTVVDKKLLSNLVKGMIKHPRVGIITPKIYFAKGFEFHKNNYKNTEFGKVLWCAGGKIDWKNINCSNIGVDQVDNGQFEEEVSVDFASGAAMFIRSEVIAKVGNFDERYFMYLEDVDLSVRTKKKGYGIIYNPSACLWHKVAQSSKIGGDLNDYFISRNRMLFGLKYASTRTKFALFRESLRLLKSGRKWQKKGIKDFYFMNYGKGSWK